ncbi:MAG: DNA gyrase C-terminal beta-propeller domain-containing protein [Deltaproteobacteria bacterium]
MIGITKANDEADIMIITDRGQVIRMMAKGISVLGRNTQGVRLIRVEEAEKVVAVEPVLESGEDGNVEET